MAARITQVFIEVLRSGSDKAGTPAAATTTFALASSPSASIPTKRVSGRSTVNLTPSPLGAGPFRVFGANGVILASANPIAKNSSTYLAAVTAMTIGGVAYPNKLYPVAGRTGFALAPVVLGRIGTDAGGRVIYADATTSMGLGPLDDGNSLSLLSVTASAGMALSASAVPSVYALLHGTGLGGMKLSTTATVARVTASAGNSAILLRSSGKAGRFLNAVASTSLGLAGPTGSSNGFASKAATTAFAMAGQAVATHGGHGAAIGLKFATAAEGRVYLPVGGGSPGVPDTIATGARSVLRQDASGRFPCSYAETPNGSILIANGVDPMFRWNALTGIAEPAGLIPPATALLLGGSGVGRITGQRVAYTRFIDREGNVSNLSPISDAIDFGRDGWVESARHDNTGRVYLRSTAHGLSYGDPVIVEGIQGLELANGTWTALVVDADNFALGGLSLVAGTYKGGGRWTCGVAAVSYSAVPIPTQEKAVHRQILRNLEGSAETVYVDIDTTDMTATDFASTKSDADLVAGDAVPLFSDDLPHADRHGPPPSHRSIIAAHLGRIFAAGEASDTRGNCNPIFGQNLVYGIGTDWKASYVGRTLYMVGATRPYEIASVDEDAQTLTVTDVIDDALGPFAMYAIRPPAAERKMVYYSEPALPESWPPWNAISVPEDSDEITGLMVKGSFLFVLERRHAYKYTFQDDPAKDGYLFLTTRRGCVNNRCHVQVEDTAYLLDEVGLYKFDGQDAEPISTPIQTMFQRAGIPGAESVNWEADQRYWHAAHDPVRDTIRWFVALLGQTYPRHAICYDYRRDRFWIEEYPFVITSSTVGTIGYRRSLAGSESRRILCLGEGSTDAVDDGNALRGPVTSAGPLSLTDSSGPFPPGLAGAPVSIASGRGFGQQRRITDNDETTLRVDRPWLERPDATSIYQIGGIAWSWRSGWFRYIEQETETSREIEVVFAASRRPSEAQMRLYHDHSESPETWGQTFAQDGYSILAGQSEITLDMTRKSGQISYKLTGHKDVSAIGDSYLSVEIAGVTGGDVQRIYQIILDGVREP